jgi:tetratricopeptide repeat protein 30
LKESALIEAFNLKAAIEYNLKKFSAAREALWDMPPRNESEFDPVTLMNHALINIDSDPTGGFKKLNYLLHNPPFPPETFANLLLLYAKFQYFDLAADVLAENSDLTFKYINQDDFEYIEAVIF